jgi:glucosyltransferase
MNTLSIILPCYNEGEILEHTYEVLTESLVRINRSYEIILVDDGSSDDTFKIIQRLRQRDSHIYGIQLSRNFGKEGVLLAGLMASKGDLVAVMDADLQDPPTLLAEMIRLIEEEGYDQVGTYRQSRRSQSFLTRLFSEAYYRTYNVYSHHQIKHNEREYRMMSRVVVDELIKLLERNRYIKALWSLIGFKTFYIGYEDVDRVGGKTKYNLSGKLKLAFRNIFSASSRPLNLIKNTTILYALVLLVASFFAQSLSLDRTVLIIGWLFLVQFIFLTLISIYLGNIYLETKQRPNFIIREALESETL